MTVDILTQTIESNSVISMPQQVLGIIHTAAFKPLWYIGYLLLLINDLSNNMPTNGMNSSKMLSDKQNIRTKS